MRSAREYLTKQLGSRLLVSKTVPQGIDGLGESAKRHGEIQVQGRTEPVQVYGLT